MIGQTIAHYRIIEKLGQGGMGEVYLADDIKLERRVALKFLPESLRNDPEARERLLREARAASQLSHPNILTIHAVEEAEGRDFIVMEYLDGQTLSEYCRTQRPTASQSLELIRQIAEGLSAAHRRGITHRDMKPANILVDTDGHLKILDFGLAKQKGLAKLTRDGSTVGTMAYTSPEQVEGREADARSDLFSLGVIAYEMLSGRRPFEGEHEAALVYAIAHEQAPSLVTGEAVPVGLQHVVNWLLAKRPEDRYQSAAELLGELRTLQPFASSVVTQVQPQRRRRAGVMIALVCASLTAVALVGWLLMRKDFGSGSGGSSERKILVVLPFENLGAADQEYFADGITEEITARLANISSLGVISRTTAMKYKGSGKGVREIGQELKADYVLEGTIRWDRSKPVHDVRITPQLIRVSDDTHLWADRIERPLEDVFAIQAEIAEKVAEAMNITLAGGERERVTAASTRNTAAYDMFLRGNEYWNRSFEWMEANLSPAEQLYSAAIREDSGFVGAYARLSQVYTEWFYHVERRPEFLIKSKELVDRAIALDPNSPEARLALGSYYYHKLDYERALEQFEIILQAQPNNGEVWMETGYVRRRQGRMSDALACFRKGTVLDPGRAGFNAIYLIGDGYMWMRRYDSAAVYLDRAIAIIPDDPGAHLSRVLNVIHRAGDIHPALDNLDRHRSVLHVSGANLGLWMRLYLFLPDAAEAIRRIESMTFPPDLNSQWLSYALAERALGYSVLGADQQRVLVLCDSALTTAQSELNLGGPPNAYLHGARGLAFALLGRRIEAIAAGDSVLQLRSLSTDAFNDIDLLETAATIYTLAGEEDRATGILEQLLSIPSPYSTRYFKLQPVFGSLSDNPRFQALMSQPDKVF